MIRDEEVVLEAREAAVGVVADDPTLARSPALRAHVEYLSRDDRSDYLEKG